MKVSVRTLVLTFGVVALIADCSKSTEPPAATSVSVSSSSVSFVSLNQSQLLTAAVLDQHGDTMQGQTITFASTNTAVATVTAGGTVKAIGDGSGSITVSSGSITKSVPVSVAQAPSLLSKTGDGQSGAPGTALSLPITVNVNDAGGSAIAGVTVAFAVTSGGGLVSPPSPVTDASGNASTTWTTGGAGAQTVSATVAGISAIGFTATAVVVGAPASLHVLSGNGQIASQGQAEPSPIQVQVLDQSSNAVPGVTVTFAVTRGGGSVNPTSTTTNASGIASTTWTTGSATVTQLATASVTSLPTVTFSGNGVPPTAAGFQVTLVNVGPPFSAAVQTAFDSAIAFWQRAITGDLADVASFTASAGQCSANSPAVGPLNVDDVLILAQFDAIDGPGKILGQSGPCFIRTTGRLTIAGTMVFDTADVAGLVSNGSLNQVIRHEMGHVLGFGTLWTQTQFNCLQLPSATGNVQDTYFNCSNGLAYFDSIGGAAYTGGNIVPVENCGPSSPTGCGAGTFNSHWREPVFGTELMTGYLNSGVPNPVSKLTIASMADLGYTVDYSASEPYSPTTPFHAPSAAGLIPGVPIDLRNDIYLGPLYSVDVSGVVRRLR